MHCLLGRIGALLLCGALAFPGRAQVRLYNAERDAAAQNAVALSEKLASGETFRRALENLSRLTERDTAVLVEDARAEASMTVDGFITWADIERFKAGLQVADEAMPSRSEESVIRADLEAREQSLHSQVERLKRSVATGSRASAEIDRASAQVQHALEHAKSLTGQDKGSDAAVRDIAGQISDLFKSYSDRMDVLSRATAKLAELRNDLQVALLRKLAVEEQFYVSEIELETRRQKDRQRIRSLLRACDVPAGIPRSERINTTLTRFGREPDRLRGASSALFHCASLAAEAHLPERLYEVRYAQLQQVESLRISAANAAIYETAIAGGVNRLALYYKGGIKPETLAEIVNSLATAGIFGKLLTK